VQEVAEESCRGEDGSRSDLTDGTASSSCCWVSQAWRSTSSERRKTSRTYPLLKTIAPIFTKMKKMGRRPGDAGIAAAAPGMAGVA